MPGLILETFLFYSSIPGKQWCNENEIFLEIRMEDVRDLGYIDLHTNVGEQKNEWDNVKIM